MAESSSSSSGIPQAEVREELARVLSSSAFAESPRLKRFLRYVVEARLAGEDDRIQEYAIGLEVFDRGESFDPRIDSIVRVEARRLRDKLGSYYETDGHNSATVIRLPRRGYAPSFEARGEAAREQGSPQPPPRTPFRKRAAVGAAIAAILAVALVVVPPSGTELSRSQGAVSFEIHPPPGTRLVPTYNGGATVLSPDGSQLVIVAREIESGLRKLYLRSLSDVATRPLLATAGARRPFWSPDGSKIGFQADLKLRVLDLSNETVVTLADAPQSRGGSWSSFEGGTIIFAPERRGGLYRIPAGGGTPEPLTEPSRNDQWVDGWPHFLPDGRRFLYSRKNRRSGDSMIRLADLESSEDRELTSAHSGAAYTRGESGGSLLFVRDDVLTAQRFDVATGQLIGKAEPFTEALESGSSSVFNYYFSASRTGTIAYRRGPSRFGESEITWYDRVGRRTGTVGPVAEHCYISLSPDEKHLASAIIDHAASSVNVWTIDIERGVATRRTNHPALDRTPVWSPDGKQLLISSSRASSSRIYSVPSGGGDASEFLDYSPDEPTDDWVSQWSSRADAVVFSRGPRRARDIFAVRPGGRPRKLIDGPSHQINGRISPDGRRIAYDSDEQGRREVFLEDYPPTGRQTRISSNGGGFPLWRGDGLELFYIEPGGNVMAAAISAGAEMEVSLPKKLFQVRFPFSPALAVYQYAVTRDGQRFLCATVKTEPPVVVVLNWERLFKP